MHNMHERDYSAVQRNITERQDLFRSECCSLLIVMCFFLFFLFLFLFDDFNVNV